MDHQKPIILVTGANGQLGMEIRALADQYKKFSFSFLSREELPIHHFQLVKNYFEVVRPAYCINCAAYTAVDKAETEKDQAMLVNGEAAGVLASVCRLTNCRFVHISTDYVFDGTAQTPYKESDATNPVNYYGFTKLRGEELCESNNPDTLLIRTAWVYSEFGGNFVKTMLRLMKEKQHINVVNDQFGTPTYAADLAAVILKIINEAALDRTQWQPGIYHYSNEGKISWYDFAVAIKALTNSTCEVNPIPGSAYPTPAKRPAYSVFDKEKIRKTYRIQIPEWKKSLQTCLLRLNALSNN
jgi:dTDP-4-dehydrorhamnose reductase